MNQEFVHKHDDRLPASEEERLYVRQLIHEEPDWPQPGINFCDLSPALADPRSLDIIISAFAHHFKGVPITHVAGIDARGFSIACART